MTKPLFCSFYRRRTAVKEVFTTPSVCANNRNIISPIPNVDLKMFQSYYSSGLQANVPGIVSIRNVQNTRSTVYRPDILAFAFSRCSSVVLRVVERKCVPRSVRKEKDEKYNSQRKKTGNDQFFIVWGCIRRRKKNKK